MNKKLAIKNYFDSMALKWDDLYIPNDEKIKMITYLADIKRDYSIIDIGCGTGVIIKYLLKYNPSFILGVDISEEMIGTAKLKFEDNRVEFLASDIFDIKGKFDLAIMYNAYPHFLEKSELVNKLASLLKTNGRFIIAHGGSKESINSIHNRNCLDSTISSQLNSVKIEKIPFLKNFNIDIEIDTDSLYIFSGVKKN